MKQNDEQNDLFVEQNNISSDIAIYKAMTPAMARYAEIKSVNPGFLLFYQMGDFFELFFEDANIAAKALDIALTKRGAHKGKPIPMCGVPVRKADEYLLKLIKKGFKVAVCEQVETVEQAKKRGYKNSVKRDVVRLVTSGTITEDNILSARNNNYIAAICENDKNEQLASIAWLDISTGEFFCTDVKQQQITAEIVRIKPAEVILTQKFANKQKKVIEELVAQKTQLTKENNAIFDIYTTEQKIKQYFQIYNIKSLGNFSKMQVAAMGALIAYVQHTQVANMPVLQKPLIIQPTDFVIIDAATRKNLEINQTTDGKYQGSLLHALDQTITPMGGRKIARWVNNPITNIQKINHRLDFVEYFFYQQEQIAKISNLLKQAADLPRAINRISLKRATPKDLANIAKSLKLFAEILKILDEVDEQKPKHLENVIKIIQLVNEKQIYELTQKIGQAFKDELPNNTKDGGFINAEFSQELQELVNLRDKSRKIITELEKKYASQTQIKNLKIKHNNILGYFIETKEQYGKILMQEPFRETFIRRQSLVGNMRFSTSELSLLESKINLAAEKIILLEKQIFEQFAEKIIQKSNEINQIANAIAYLDTCVALAKISREREYVRPQIVKDTKLQIEKARHPIIEYYVKQQQEKQFIANDCVMKKTANPNKKNQDNNIWILTGPNMGGKSTFLRQNALLIIMAQIGSFVPAQNAVIGIVDQIFSRVGASDDLARGESTFMVEMSETATILHQATEKSFIILDEIGRGTATFDGMAIAFAVVEYLCDQINPRAIIATHFHELVEISNTRNNIELAFVKVVEWKDELRFLYQVKKGIADRSYGIQVAKLAGVPHTVYQRAKIILKKFENKRNYQQNNKNTKQDEYETKQDEYEIKQNQLDMVKNVIDQIKPDEITPIKALETIYELKKLFQKQEKN